MKRFFTFILILFVISAGLGAQDTDASEKIRLSNDSVLSSANPAASINDSTLSNVDSTAINSIVKKNYIGQLVDKDGLIKSKGYLDSLQIYAWKITPRLGERIFTDRDTLLTGFNQTSLTDGKDVAVGYLANLGSPAQSKIFFSRPESSRFLFLDAMYYWRKNPEDHLFLNTKKPYSNVFYQSGGSGITAEKRLMTQLSSNFGKKLNLGFDFDYVYTRGFYNSLYNKQMNYDLYGSYIGDKYKMHAFVANNNFNNSENGGITNDLYITNPNSDELRQFSGNSQDIPVRMHNTFNRMRGRHIYVTNRYDLGNDEYPHRVNDSTVVMRKKENYVPLASVTLTSHYTDQRRRFITSNDTLENVFKPYYTQYGNKTNNPDSIKYSQAMNDYMAYYSFKNTLALTLNEGFRSWTKFGLTAFIEYDMRKYSLPSSIPKLNTRHGEDVLTVGGVLSKEQSEFLKYRLSAEKNLLDTDFKMEGEVTTRLNLWGKSMAVKAKAYIKNLKPSFYEENFSSKYRNWNFNFEDIRRVYAGGEIILPSLSFMQMKLSGGVENIQNYIYYGADSVTAQKSGSLQVFSLRLDQKLQAGILNWDNQIVYQATSDDAVLPLPAISVYSNLYISAKLAKVLGVRLGVDAHFHTEYYAPGYDPLTMQFFNQRQKKIGNFPIATAYLNLHLKKTRFFVMMYNVAQGLGNSQSFTLLNYPVNPRGLKMGLSWDFTN